MAETGFQVRLTFAMLGHGIRTLHASAGPGPPLAWWVRMHRVPEPEPSKYAKAKEVDLSKTGPE